MVINLSIEMHATFYGRESVGFGQVKMRVQPCFNRTYARKRFRCLSVAIIGDSSQKSELIFPRLGEVGSVSDSEVSLDRPPTQSLG